MKQRALLGTALVLVVLVSGVVLARTPRGSLERPRHLPPDRAQAVLYVALGDSTVYGVGATATELNYVSRLHDRLRAVYPSARVANLAVSGATAADVVADQLPRAVQMAPDLVTLSVGPNDITGRRDVKSYERDLERILATLGRDTRAVIVVNLIPDLAVTPRFRGGEAAPVVGALSRRFNEALARRAREVGAEVVDLYTRSREEVPARPELVSADGYHPSDLGYARWAELMWEGITRRIRRRLRRELPARVRFGIS